MEYQVLARKWRPQRFEDVVGQDHITTTLQNAIQKGRIHHAYLFTGSRGIGKTSVARILAKALNCKSGPTPKPCQKCTPCSEITSGTSVAVLEIDGASNTGVDDIRELRQGVKYLPAGGKYKIYIIDEVHMLSTSAFNALLKTLEEPPAHVIFIFATTEPHKIPLTILSRCLRFDFKRIPVRMIMKGVQGILKEEGFSVDEEGLYLISREAEGSFRDALSLLEQVLAFSEDKKVKSDEVVKALGLIDRSFLYQASKAIIDGNPQVLLDIVNKMHEFGTDLGQFAKDFLEHWRNLLISKIATRSELLERLCDLPENERGELVKQGASISRQNLEHIFSFLFRRAEEILRSNYPKNILEVSLIQMTHLAKTLPIEDLISRLEVLERSVRGGSENRPLAKPIQNPTSSQSGAETAKTTRVDVATSGEKDWDGFLSFAKGNKPGLGNMLEYGKLIGHDGNLSVIGYVQGTFYASRLSERDAKEELDKLGMEFFGKDHKIKIQILKQGEGLPHLEKNPAGGSRSSSQKSNANNVQIKGNTLVKEAVDIFGAQITAIKKK